MDISETAKTIAILILVILVGYIIYKIVIGNIVTRMVQSVA